MSTPHDLPDDTAQRLRRAVTRLHRRLRATSLGGTSPAQASLLATVGKLERATLGELASAEQVQPPTMTRLVRDCEAAGLVERVRDHEDRRQTRVVLTAAGRRELATIRQRKTAFLEATLSGLDPAERRQALEAVAFLERLVERS